MHKTSLYLTEGELARLAFLADWEATSQAEVIRRAIRLYEPERRGDRRFSLVRSVEGLGDSVAGVTEDDLLEGFGD